MIVESPAQPASAAQHRSQSGTQSASGRAWLSGRELGEFLFVSAQVFLALVVIKQFSIESASLRRVLYIAGGGFVINYFLPGRFRLAGFLCLFLVAGIVVFGQDNDNWLASAALLRMLTLFGVGGMLIAICHLPIGFWQRSTLLAVAAVMIAIMHGGYFGPSVLKVVWPVVAALFMFRIIIYHYVVSTSPQRTPLLQLLSYFYLLPNIACMLFPVVDFATFRSCYQNPPTIVIYQRGVRWIVRGIVQLLAYRMVSEVLMLKPEDVLDGKDLVQFIFANAFLYVRVSGLLHLVVGVLLLFGFNLPETSHRYFLASSFTDYWRRVNIYWKDFILQVFFYPSYFRFQRRGPTLALTIATLYSFTATWLLHAYQTWWLKNTTSFSWPDTLFWFVLALLVLLNSLWEMKFGRQRRLPGGRFRLVAAMQLALYTAGTFACIAVLWSLWNSPSVGEWVQLWKLVDGESLMWASAALATIGIAAILLEDWFAPQIERFDAVAAKRLMWSLGLAHIGILSITYLVGLAAVQFLFPPRVQPYLEALTKADSRANRGYYEALLGAQGQHSGEDQASSNGLSGSPFVRPVNDFRLRELMPSTTVTFGGVNLSTNRWGMRDQDYELAKPPETMRMVVLGSSNTMGFGLEKPRMWESLLEDRLNRTASANGVSTRFEILNLAMMGYSPLSQIMAIRNHAAQFQPDVVLFVTHSLDQNWVPRDLITCQRRGVPIPFEYLREVLTTAHVGPRTNEVIALGRLKPYESELYDWSCRQIVAECRAINTAPVGILMQLPWEIGLRSKLTGQAAINAEMLAALNSAGFDVIDMSTTFDGMSRSELVLNLSDRHCNAKANAVIASVLYDKLISDPRIGVSPR